MILLLQYGNLAIQQIKQKYTAGASCNWNIPLVATSETCCYDCKGVIQFMPSIKEGKQPTNIIVPSTVSSNHIGEADDRVLDENGS